MKYPYSVKINGVYYPAGTEILPEKSEVKAPSVKEVVTEKPDFEAMSVKELRAYAKDNGIVLGNARVREEILAIITA